MRYYINYINGGFSKLTSTPTPTPTPIPTPTPTESELMQKYEVEGSVMKDLKVRSENLGYKNLLELLIGKDDYLEFIDRNIDNLITKIEEKENFRLKSRKSSRLGKAERKAKAAERIASETISAERRAEIAQQDGEISEEQNELEDIGNIIILKSRQALRPSKKRRAQNKKLQENLIENIPYTPEESYFIKYSDSDPCELFGPIQTPDNTACWLHGFLVSILFTNRGTTLIKKLIKKENFIKIIEYEFKDYYNIDKEYAIYSLLYIWYILIYGFCDLEKSERQYFFRNPFEVRPYHDFSIEEPIFRQSSDTYSFCELPKVGSYSHPTEVVSFFNNILNCIDGNNDFFSYIKTWSFDKYNEYELNNLLDEEYKNSRSVLLIYIYIGNKKESLGHGLKIYNSIEKMLKDQKKKWVIESISVRPNDESHIYNLIKCNNSYYIYDNFHFVKFEKIDLVRHLKKNIGYITFYLFNSDIL